MRKEITVTIETDNRDKDKAFFIREMSAMKAEKWATRVLLALTHSGVDVPEDIGYSGLAGVATLGLKAFFGVHFADAEPLLDEMMGCVQLMPDPAHPQVRRALVEDDIEEVSTLLFLREEVIFLHVGFSISGFLSKMKASQEPIKPSSNTATSPAP